MRVYAARTERAHMRDPVLFSAERIWSESDAILANELLAFWRDNCEYNLDTMLEAFLQANVHANASHANRIWVRLQSWPHIFEVAALRDQLDNLTVDGVWKTDRQQPAAPIGRFKYFGFTVNVGDMQDVVASDNISEEALRLFCMMAMDNFPENAYVYAPYLISSKKVSLKPSRYIKGKGYGPASMPDIAAFPRYLRKHNCWAVFVVKANITEDDIKVLEVILPHAIDDALLRIDIAQFSPFCKSHEVRIFEADGPGHFWVFQALVSVCINDNAQCDKCLELTILPVIMKAVVTDLVKRLMESRCADVDILAADCAAVEAFRAYFQPSTPVAQDKKRSGPLLSMPKVRMKRQKAEPTRQQSLSDNDEDTRSVNKLERATEPALSQGKPADDAPTGTPKKRLRLGSGATLKEIVQNDIPSQSSRICAGVLQTPPRIEEVRLELLLEYEDMAQKELQKWISEKYRSPFLTQIASDAKDKELQRIKRDLLMKHGETILDTPKQKPDLFSGPGHRLSQDVPETPGDAPDISVLDKLRDAATDDNWPERALKVKAEYAELIISGKKTWEIRSTRTTKFKERIAISPIGKQTLIGDIVFTNCLEISKNEFNKYFGRHCVPASDAANVIGNYSKIYAWGISAPRAYANEVHYRTKTGQMSWVKLNDASIFAATRCLVNTDTDQQSQSCSDRLLSSDEASVDEEVPELEPDGRMLSEGQTVASLQDLSVQDLPDVRLYKAGIRNIGNTCFYNAVLVNISSAFQFGNRLRKHLAKHEEDESNETCVRCKLACDLNSLEDSNRKTIFSPLAVKQCCMNMWAPDYLPNQQQDAAEALRYLLQHVHREDFDSIKHLVAPSQTLKVEATTCVSEYFRIVLKKTIMCTECAHTNESEEQCFTLELAMPDDKLTIEELVGAQFANETLEEYKCDGCKREGTCFQTKSVESWPPVLVVHLKRFTGALEKIDRHIHFEDILCLANETYSLQATVEHSGTVEHGHYVSNVRDSRDHWVRINDSRIFKTTMNTIRKGRCEDSQPYLLTYQKATQEST